MTSPNAHIVIVGAGLCGLSAALSILEACDDNKVTYPSITIIEADDRVGGRTKTVTHHNIPCDYGAHFVGPTHHNILKLLKKLKLTISPQFNDYSKIFLTHNNISTFKGEIPTPMGVFSLLGMQSLVSKFNKIAQLYGTKKYETEAAAEAKENINNGKLSDEWSIEAREYFDSITVQSLMNETVWNNDEAVESMTFLFCRLVMGCEPSQVSALQLIDKIKQATDIDGLANVKDGYVFVCFVLFCFVLLLFSCVFYV